MKNICLALVCLGLGACASSAPSNFYQLGFEPGPAPVTAPPQTVIGVGPVTVPEYLRKPQIARRVSAVELEYLEFSRWAESLEVNVPRFLGQALSDDLGGAEVQVYPFRNSTALKYQVLIDLNRFEYIEYTGKVEISASYEILNSDTRRRVKSGQFDHSQLVSGSSVESQVAALEALLIQLAGEIAAQNPKT